MRTAILCIGLGFLATAATAVLAQSDDAGRSSTADDRRIPTGDTSESICLLIESAAAANGLPVEFFARVIWQESRFKPDAVGPATRSGDRARGIAQFMPRTAAERGLLDPLDPVQALPKSAEFLHDLLGEFGNLGLAAAVYNAGPARVHDWLARRSTLPRQTELYVRAITGRSADDWAAGPPAGAAHDAPAQPPGCGELTALLGQAPNPYVVALERRVGEIAAAPWGIELSAGFSRAKVLAAYAAVEKRHGALLAGHDPTILRVTLRSRGSQAFYQARIGASTRTEADKLCSGLRRAGGACLVLRNPRGA